MRKTGASRPIRLRSLLLGSVLIPVNLYWLMKAEVVWVSVYSTVLSLFFNVVFCLFFLVLLNQFVKRYIPDSAMNRGELLTIYSMLSIATGIFGHDFIRILIHTMGASHWFATPENEWNELFFRYLPGKLIVTDRSALQAYYEGSSTLYTTRHIEAWLPPALAWSSLLLVVLFVMLCINVIIRKQWTEHERLTYPITLLPLEMTTPRFFRNKLLWLGFGLAGMLDLLNGLHYLFPAVPQLHLRSNLGVFFTEKPFSAMGWTPLCLYPFIVGLSYFIPLSLSFSCWFFYVFWKAQLVLRSGLGMSPMPGPYLSYQSSGAWIGLGLLSLWLSRRHLSVVLKSITVRESTMDDSSEPMRYRTAILGVLLGGLFILLFCTQAGMSFWVVPPLFGLYFLIGIAVARMRAALGPPTHDLYDIGPERLMVSALGPRRLGPGNLTLFSLFYWLGYDYRSHPMGHQLEGFKLAERVDMDSRRLVGAMMFAAVIGIVAAFWAFLHVAHQEGAQHFGATGIGWASFRHLQTWLNYPTEIDVPLLQQAGFGLGFTFLLMLLRRMFFQLPLDPVGYAVAGSWTMSWMWFSILLGWLVKRSILKFGGIRAHQQAAPFFLGMVLGQYMVGSLWTLASEVFQRTMYGFFP